MSVAFSSFMYDCLYDKTHGYYMQSKNPVAVAGDYITAPELSPALAYACASAYMRLNFDVICEVGPGSGQLIYQILQILEAEGSMPKTVYLIELNNYRRQQQQDLLSDFAVEIIWLKSMPQFDWQGMLIANEVLDAQPFDLVCKANNVWQELCVDYNAGAYNLVAADIRSELIPFLPKTEVSSPYRTEVFPGIPGFINDLTKHMAQGAVIFIDYGYSNKEYYHPHRNTGTSKIFFEHGSSNNLLHAPGKSDITAHVDFSAVKDALLDNNFVVNSFMTQAQFIMQTKAYNYLSLCDNAVYNKSVAGFKSLVFEMGDVFKVLLAEKASDVWAEWLKGYGLDRL